MWKTMDYVEKSITIPLYHSKTKHILLRLIQYLHEETSSISVRNNICKNGIQPGKTLCGHRLL